MRRKSSDEKVDRRPIVRSLENPPAVLKPLIIILSWVYGAAAGLNRTLFNMGVCKRARLPKPVISIGNLAAGGGGKTPLVMWLAGELGRRGIRPAVLTRGYGRSSREVVQASAAGPYSIGLTGDEPALMAKHLADIPIFVSGERYRAGISALEKYDVDLFLLDDGFQHHALYRDLDIVAVDDGRRLGNLRPLPAGILREPVRCLRNADMIVVTKADRVDSAFHDYLGRTSGAPVLWSCLKPVYLRVGAGRDTVDPGKLRDERLSAFCGIADPESFMKTLEDLDITPVRTEYFPDHHPYSEEDVEMLVKAASAAGAAGFITTEKDAVRFPAEISSLPCYAVVMEVSFITGESEILRMALSAAGAGGDS